MRTYQIIAVAAVILAGVGQQIFFTSGADVSQQRQDAAQAQAANFSPDCAREEIAATTMIEDHGAAGDLSTDRLGQAGLTMLRARMACYEGHVGEALALYEGILNLGPVASLSGQ